MFHSSSSGRNGKSCLGFSSHSSGAGESWEGPGLPAGAGAGAGSRGGHRAGGKQPGALRPDSGGFVAPAVSACALAFASSPPELSCSYVYMFTRSCKSLTQQRHVSYFGFCFPLKDQARPPTGLSVDTFMTPFPK